MNWKTPAGSLVAPPISTGIVQGCAKCRAFQQFDVYPSWHAKRGQVYVSRERVCVCPPESFEPIATPENLTGECEDCGRPCWNNAKRCTECSNAAQVARHAARNAMKVCADCGGKLDRRRTMRCDACKKARDRDKWYKRQAARRAA